MKSLSAALKGILPNGIVTVVDVKWYGTAAVELTYKDAAGRPGNELLYRDREPTLEIATGGRPWSFDGDGALLRAIESGLPRLDWERDTFAYAEGYDAACGRARNARRRSRGRQGRGSAPAARRACCRPGTPGD